MDHLPPSSGEITRALQKLSAGERRAWDELIPQVYDGLRKLANRYIQHEPNRETLQPTEIVHEVYLRLMQQQSAHWVNRNHFFGVAAHLMRLILIDRARSSARRRETFLSTEDPSIQISDDPAGANAEAIEAALRRLAELDARQAWIVELRFFGGLSIEETADVLGISTRTVNREWSTARAWLHLELGPSK